MTVNHLQMTIDCKVIYVWYNMETVIGVYMPRIEMLWLIYSVCE